MDSRPSYSGSGNPVWMERRTNLVTEVKYTPGGLTFKQKAEEYPNFAEVTNPGQRPQPIDRWCHSQRPTLAHSQEDTCAVAGEKRRATT